MLPSTEEFTALSIARRCTALCTKFQLDPSFLLPTRSSCTDECSSHLVPASDVVTEIVTALSEQEGNSIVTRFVNKHGHMCTVGFTLDLGNLWWTNHTTKDCGDAAHAGDLWFQCYLLGGPLARTDTFKTLAFVRSLLDDLKVLKRHNKY